MSSPSLTHDKGLPKHLEELDKSHLELDLRHKQPGRAPSSPGHPHSPAGQPAVPLHTQEDRGTRRGRANPAPQLEDATTPPLTGSAPPTGSGKLGGEATHLPHLRPLTESQPSSSPLLQAAPGVKGHQRVVTLAQHISVTTPLCPSHHLCMGGRTRPWGGGRRKITRSPSV